MSKQVQVRWHPPTDALADVDFQTRVRDGDFATTIKAVIVHWNGRDRRVAWSSKNQCLWVLEPDPAVVVGESDSLFQLAQAFAAGTIQVRPPGPGDAVQLGRATFNVLTPADRRRIALACVTTAAAFALSNGCTLDELRQCTLAALGLDDIDQAS